MVIVYHRDMDEGTNRPFRPLKPNIHQQNSIGFNLRGIIPSELFKKVELFMRSLTFTINEIEKHMNIVVIEELLTPLINMHTGILRVKAVMSVVEDLDNEGLVRDEEYYRRNRHVDRAVLEKLGKDTCNEVYISSMIEFVEKVIFERINPLLNDILSCTKKDEEKLSLIEYRANLINVILERCSKNIQFGLNLDPTDIVSSRDPRLYMNNQKWVFKIVRLA